MSELTSSLEWCAEAYSAVTALAKYSDSNEMSNITSS